jgi:thiol-disulfide isomerase/thioredoxin
MVKVSKLFCGVLFMGALISATAFAQTPAKDAIKAINEYRVQFLAEARQSGKPINIAVLNEGVKAKAEAAVKDIDATKVDAKDAYDWAQVFSLAQRHKEVCDLCHRFLTTSPTPEAKYAAQTLMMNSCNALGEGEMLAMTLRDVKPVNSVSGRSLALTTANSYADTIAKARGVDEALKVLDEILAKMPADDHKENAKAMLEAAKAREARTDPPVATKPDADRLAEFELSSINMRTSAIFAIANKRHDLLLEAGRKVEAKKALQDFVASADPRTASHRSAKASLLRAEMIGAKAPSLNSERSYGEFKGLDALKGKVVIIDFFAHWCGPCKASYPDMRKLYDELNPKGLEMVGVTTYYGYYGAERGISKDAEYAKMADFIKEFNIAWPVVYGERSNFEAYGVTGIPHVTVLDRKGNVHSIEIGYSPAIFKKFRAEIEKLIDEK